MPFIEIPLDEAEEDVIVPEGEYDLRVNAFQSEESKKGHPMYHAMIQIEDPDYPNAALIHEYFNEPLDGDEPRTRNFKIRNLARFLKLFDVPHEGGGFNDEDVPGATARCLVTIDPGEGNYEESNRLRLPKLRK